MDQPASMDAVRARIDAIDEAVHRLLMERAAVVAPLAALKAKASPDGGRGDFIRPAREALILRRLVARHEGPVPASVIVHVWRELIAANLHLQGPFSVHVPAGDLDLRDLARASFGVMTPLADYARAEAVLAAVASTPGAVGLLPVPVMGTPPWWRGLDAASSSAAEAPRIVGRLPFLAADPVAPAYVLACVSLQASGADTTVVSVCDPAALAAAGGRIIAAADGAPALGEIAGFHPDAAERIPGVQVIGAYADPIPA